MSAGLGLVSLSAGSLALTACSKGTVVLPGEAGKLGCVLGFARYSEQQGGASRYSMCLLDLDQANPVVATFPMGFFGHGIAVDPNDANRLLVFEKRGPGCCVVDLVSGSIVRLVGTLVERQFYGHGAFSVDGSLVYCTEADLQNDYKGVIAVRDTKDFKVLGEFPSHGIAPHDCRLVDEGKTMVIANGGGPVTGPGTPCVTYVDVQSEKLIETIPVVTNGVQAGHLDLTSAGDLAVVGGPRDGLGKISDLRGAVNLRKKGSKLLAMDEPDSVTSLMMGESLSVSIHEPSSTVAVTNPDGDIVTFWSLDKGSWLKSMKLVKPRGVSLTLDGRHFIVSHGKDGSILRIDAETLEPVPGSEVTRSFFSGSHLVTWDRPG